MHFLTLVLLAQAALPLGSSLVNPVSTSGPVSLYVATTGSDSNPCTSSLSPCLTVDGARKKLPPIIADPVTISVAAGTYSAGAYLSGFVFAPARTPGSGAYINIVGSFTALDTGTSSAGSNGSGATRATLTDSTKTWTSNAYVGKLLEITSGGCTSGFNCPWYIIESNTDTVLSLADGPQATLSGTATGLTSSLTYRILDWATVINNVLTGIATARPINLAGAQYASTATNQGGFLIGSNANATAPNLVIRGFKFTTATGSAIVSRGASIFTVEGCRFNTTTSSNTVVRLLEDFDVLFIHNSALLGAGQTLIGSATQRYGGVLTTNGNYVDGNTTGSYYVFVPAAMKGLFMSYDTSVNTVAAALRLNAIEDGWVRYVKFDGGQYGLRWGNASGSDCGSGMLAISGSVIQNTTLAAVQAVCHGAILVLDADPSGTVSTGTSGSNTGPGIRLSGGAYVIVGTAKWAVTGTPDIYIENTTSKSLANLIADGVYTGTYGSLVSKVQP
jgi:hypothetical protein